MSEGMWRVASSLLKHVLPQDRAARDAHLHFGSDKQQKMAEELDSAALKVIQLECIITAKDKEISLLREQLSQDQGVGALWQQNSTVEAPLDP